MRNKERSCAENSGKAVVNKVESAKLGGYDEFWKIGVWIEGVRARVKGNAVCVEATIFDWLST